MCSGYTNDMSETTSNEEVLHRRQAAVPAHLAACDTCKRAGYRLVVLMHTEAAYSEAWENVWQEPYRALTEEQKTHFRVAWENNEQNLQVTAAHLSRISTGGAFTGAIVVTLTPPSDASKLGDAALWTALAVMGRWSGTGRSYHGSTAVVIALQVVTDALRADFPKAHGWKAPVPP